MALQTFSIWISMQILLGIASKCITISYTGVRRSVFCHGFRSRALLCNKASNNPRVPSLVHSIFIVMLVKKKIDMSDCCVFWSHCPIAHCFCSGCTQWPSFLFPVPMEMLSFSIVNTAVHQCYVFFYCHLLDIWGKVNY